MADKAIVVPCLRSWSWILRSGVVGEQFEEEYQSLIPYVKNNKNADKDWFQLQSNKEGTRWFGKRWFIHDLHKYEFDIEFGIPIMFLITAPEMAVPELDEKTANM